MKTLSRLLFPFTLILCSSTARADLNELFDDAFGAMVNTTAPAAYSGSTRGILVGGGVEVRTKLTQPPSLIGITPPRVKSGCGGISLFGGAFSAINLDEFTEYLRSVMSASLGYLFQIGIESICPSCASVLNTMQEFVGKANSYLKDSCQMGILIANESGAARAFNFEETNAFNEAVGAFDSAADGFVKRMPSFESGSEQAYDIDPDEQRKAFTGNLVYSALKQAQAAQKFQPSATDASLQRLREEMMSLTGTLVFSSDANGSVKAVPFAPTIDMKDLLGGKELSDEDKTPAILRCDSDPEDKCTNPTRVGDPGFLPMKDRVQHILSGGSGKSAYGLQDTIGIAQKIIQDVALSPQENALLQSTRLPILAMLVDLRPSEAALEEQAEQLAPFIAVDIVANALSQLYKEIQIAIDAKTMNSTVPELKMFRQRVTELKKDVHMGRIEVSDRYQTLTDLLTKQRQVRASFNGQTNYSVDPGSQPGNPG